VISHRFRCIFIHVPRCAGTSVEEWICGRNWWTVHPQTKHLLASQAKRIYAPWWPSYYKFAIIREPVSRFLSCLKYGAHFGLAADDRGSLDFTGYRRLFGREIVVEHDHRFFHRADLIQDHHRPGAVYGNILDSEIDYVGRFETLSESMAEVRRVIGHPAPFDHWTERSNRPGDASLPRIDDGVAAEISAMCADDYDRFGYERPR
jgi:hypothetical protein